jgi:DNA end-binding protein Ku
MAARPYWSGQFKVSLVSFGIQLFPATQSQSGVTFHQLDRETGQRIRHRNVVGDDEPVQNSEIVKGYEYTKGKYLIVEPDEIAKLRVETKSVIDVQQFVALDELPPALFEKPYFVVPDPRESAGAFAVVRKAMEQTGKAALGEIAFAGREHLIAVAVPPDKSLPGLMAYTLRYEDELREGKDYFSSSTINAEPIDKKQLDLATQLIESYSRPLELNEFKDDYELALRNLIEAKQKNLPLPLEEDEARPAKVINLMDALRQSVSQSANRTKRPAAATRRPVQGVPKKGPVSVGVGRRKHRAA